MARQDKVKRLTEKAKDAEAKKLARQHEVHLVKERDRVKKAKKTARRSGEVRAAEKLKVQERKLVMKDIAALLKDIDLDGDILPVHPNQSELDQLKEIRKAHTLTIGQGNFHTDLFSANPLLGAGKKMFQELEKIAWDTCCVCLERYICVKVGPKSKKCQRCANNPCLFAAQNDLNPTVAPLCLSRLSPIEKSAISLICPIIAIYRKGISTASKGHTISVMQDVTTLARDLPRLPKDLPYFVIKGPNEKMTDQAFRVRRNFLIEALTWLHHNNPDYQHIVISQDNADHYPEDDILQDMPQIDPAALKIPKDAPTAANQESVVDEASTVQIPQVTGTVLEGIVKHFQLPWPKREQKPASEFTPGFFSKSFPDLFPEGKGDITKPRLGKNPSLKKYFQHLFRLNRAFVEHHCFTFVATNMLRRHAALTTGNVFSKYSAENLTMSELKKLVETGNERIIKKLMYFAAPIPGTRQNLRYQTDKAVSLVKFVRITSDDKDMFNFFQTFSAADFHWDDLHRLLPNSNEYLDKRLVDSMAEVSEHEQADCITRSEDGRLRTLNLQKHADIVDWYFYHRLQALLKHVMPLMGVKDWIVRYEVQARGTIHAHLLVRVKDGPSNKELEHAYLVPPKTDGALRQTIVEAQTKIIDFSTQVLGISAIHPNPEPSQWPGPYGQNVHTPPSNCLRARFNCLNNTMEKREQYENLINRCMLHQCKEGYCLNRSKRDPEGNMICRFKFPMEPHAFQLNFEPNLHGQQLASANKIPVGSGKGADFEKGNLIFWRNHPALVHHVPELLLIWGANIEGRPVQSYHQTLRYLLKYMMKDEPNSASFGAVLKGVVEASKDEEPVRKAFQKMLMKTVGEHDLSKQECHHILNGLDFVEFSCDFVPVNIMGTKRVRTPKSADDNMEATDTNLANIYWTRETDTNYLKAVALHQSGIIKWNPAVVSLYQFAWRFTKVWTWNKSERVPHITPNFNYIPRKWATDPTRYILFLESILLLHKPGITLEQVKTLTPTLLDEAVQVFLKDESCPKLVLEEYQESQMRGATDDHLKVSPENKNLEDEEELMKPFGDEPELFVAPEKQPESHDQDGWMEALKPIHDHEQQFYETETDYDDLDILAAVGLHNWQADKDGLNLTAVELRELPLWIKEQRETFQLKDEIPSNSAAPTYAQLNPKQKIAFHILDAHIQEAKANGLLHLKQLLLNISGGAGTGKTFWLNAVRAHATLHLDINFVKSAAPSGTAAFLIGGETLHSLLYLPIGRAKLEPLQGERLAEIQRRFHKVGVLIIDEKSMIGQEIFWMVSERLKQARPQGCSEPFGGLSVILLGDWKQLPPVCDAPLYSSVSKNPRGYNLYQLFDEVVMFEQVQRQLGDDQALFRQELQSLGNGTFSEKSWHRWHSRALDLLPPKEQESFKQTATLACAIKADMVQHNIAKVKANGQPIAPIYAVSAPKEACKASAERSCGLGNKIVISKNTVVRLTANLWTKAGLTNGAVGFVHSIIYADGQLPPALPESVIVIFPDYKGPSYLKDVPNAVPITPVCREWFSNKIHCSRTMFPFILGYALSIHKLQGSTCDKLILNPGKTEFASGLLLVGATRTTTFEGLAFAPFPNFSRFEQVNKSKGLKMRLKEEKKMEELEVATLLKFSTVLSRPVEPSTSIQNATLELQLSPDGDSNMVSIKQTQGVVWGIGLVENSCPIDNFFTLLLFKSDFVLENLGVTPVEFLLKRITQLLVAGEQGKAKELWANYLYSEKHILEVKNASGSYDTFGTEHKMLYSSLGEIQRIRSTSTCTDCSETKIQHFENFLLQAGDNIQGYLQFLSVHLTFGRCLTCKSMTLVDHQLSFASPDPWLFVVNVDGSQSIAEILTAPKTTAICGTSFSLAMISLQQGTHFTSLFWYSNSWLFYDGMKNDSKLIAMPFPLEDIATHQPMHVVYLKN